MTQETTKKKSSHPSMISENDEPGNNSDHVGNYPDTKTITTNDAIVISVKSRNDTIGNLSHNVSASAFSRITRLGYIYLTFILFFQIKKY